MNGLPANHASQAVHKLKAVLFHEKPIDEDWRPLLGSVA
jgi:hypothetical protein